MTEVEILPDILAVCLKNIENIMQHLTLIVPEEIYLPAPPVFCPQIFSFEIAQEEDGQEKGRGGKGSEDSDEIGRYSSLVYEVLINFIGL